MLQQLNESDSTGEVLSQSIPVVLVLLLHLLLTELICEMLQVAMY